ncbi:MAG: SixA phosphatase family protein [Myxococcota bacterium]
MKLLTLIRHAKSSWKDPGREDFDRPLNKRGKRDAPDMGERLATGGAIPELILSSSAQRAADTAREIAAQLGSGVVDLVFEPGLYLASAGQLLDAVRGIDQQVGHVALVAHNPGITDLVNALADVRIDNVPTCGVANLRLDVERWSDADLGRGELLDFDYPKRERGGAR